MLMLCDLRISDVRSGESENLKICGAGVAARSATSRRSKMSWLKVVAPHESSGVRLLQQSLKILPQFLKTGTASDCARECTARESRTVPSGFKCSHTRLTQDSHKPHTSRSLEFRDGNPAGNSQGRQPSLFLPASLCFDRKSRDSLRSNVKL